MIAAVMQPYLFPYIGYFQLMRAVDVFVFYDDVQYMKGGWINRNRILVNAAPGWLTLPVKREGLELDIDKRSYIRGAPDEKIKRQLRASYTKAPYFDATYALVDELLGNQEDNVARFNAYLLTKLAEHLGLRCTFATSSQIAKPDYLHGEPRVIDLCRRIGADTYVNSIGGLSLYDGRTWKTAGMELRFLRSEAHDYPQFGGVRVGSLSILDVLMFNSVEQIQEMLDQYAFVLPDEVVPHEF